MKHCNLNLAKTAGIIMLLSVLLAACSSSDPDEAGLKNLCDGEAIESAAAYDQSTGEQMVAVYTKNEGSSYTPPNISTSSMPDSLKGFVNTHFVDEEEEYSQASLVLCLSAVDSELVMSCGFKNEDGDEVTIDYLATLYDVNLYVAQTGELLDSTQIELGYKDDSCPTNELVKTSQARFFTEIPTKYTSQTKGYRDLFWGKTADFLVPYVKP